MPPVWTWFKQFVGGATANEHDVDVEAVEEIIGYHFRDLSHLFLALTHRSYSHANGEFLPSNERLEFLGDSVLGLVIADQLFQDHHDLREGEMTKLKALLVNEGTLAEVGRQIKLDQHLLLSVEEDRAGGAQRPSILSDALESVFGAVYLDGGIHAAADVILRLIYARKHDITTDESRRNYKGELLEIIQAEGNGMPRYDVTSETGPDHQKVFHVEVSVRGEMVGTGEGNSKKEAEQKAAAVALEHFANT